MSEQKGIGETMMKLIAQIEDARGQLDRAQQNEDIARSDTTRARNHLNTLQKEFDKQLDIFTADGRLQYTHWTEKRRANTVVANSDR